MRRAYRGLVVLALVGSGGAAAKAYVPPAGFEKNGVKFAASAVALGPGGRVAVATDNFAGGATVDVYPSLAAVIGDAIPLATFTQPDWRFIAGVEFVDADTIVFAENGSADTAYRGLVGGGAAVALAPAGSIPNLADLAVRGGSVYLPTADGSGKNDLYVLPVSGGAPARVITDFGAGFGGGVAFDVAGNVFLADSAGAVLRYSPAFVPLGSIPLTGNGAVDLIFDSEGDLIVSTGSTLTRVPGGTGAAEVFGTFSDPFAFPTFLAYGGSGFEPYGGGDGLLLVSGFTEEVPAGGVFGIVAAVPEPSAIGAVVVAAVAVAGRRRRR